ncbi:MAG: hypothetical protein WAU78_10475 [Roseiarcus sp.]
MRLLEERLRLQGEFLALLPPFAAEEREGLRRRAALKLACIALEPEYALHWRELADIANAMAGYLTEPGPRETGA